VNKSELSSGAQSADFRRSYANKRGGAASAEEGSGEYPPEKRPWSQIDTTKNYAFGFPSDNSRSPFPEIRDVRDRVMKYHATHQALVKERGEKQNLLVELNNQLYGTQNERLSNKERKVLVRRLGQATARLDKIAELGRLNRDQALSELFSDGSDGGGLHAARVIQRHGPDANTQRDQDMVRESVGRVSQYIEWPDNIAFDVTIMNDGSRGYQLGGNIWIDKASDYGTIAHEMGHVLDHHNQHSARRAENYLNERLYRYHRALGGDHVNTAVISLKDLLPGRGYESDEVVMLDQFRDAYMGKIYRHREPHGVVPTEVTSMGLESLMTNPTVFARDDPDYFDFILETIKGYDRYSDSSYMSAQREDQERYG
jgi:hypothetical protein